MNVSGRMNSTSPRIAVKSPMTALSSTMAPVMYQWRTHLSSKSRYTKPSRRGSKHASTGGCGGFVSGQADCSFVGESQWRNMNDADATTVLKSWKNIILSSTVARQRHTGVAGCELSFFGGGRACLPCAGFCSHRMYSACAATTACGGIPCGSKAVGPR